MASDTAFLPQIHQLKITLQYTKPPIWRRLLLPSDASLYGLHHAIQAAMGWHNCHLHQFTQGEVYYGTPQQDHMFLMKDERRYYLDNVIPLPGMKLTYEYDFGDSWEHLFWWKKSYHLTP